MKTKILTVIVSLLILTSLAGVSEQSVYGCPSSQKVCKIEVLRDNHGKIKRSSRARHEFMKETGYLHGRPGYIIDHIIPLKRGGLDEPSNMQWQTVEEAKAKDKIE